MEEASRRAGDEITARDLIKFFEAKFNTGRPKLVKNYRLTRNKTFSISEDNILDQLNDNNYSKETRNDSEHHIMRINEETKSLEHQLKTIEDKCLQNIKSLYNIDCIGHQQLQIERAQTLMLISKQMKHFAEDLKNSGTVGNILQQIDDIGEGYLTIDDALIKLDNIIAASKYRLGNKNFVKNLCHSVTNLKASLSNPLFQGEEFLEMSVKDTSRQEVGYIYDEEEGSKEFYNETDEVSINPDNSIFTLEYRLSLNSKDGYNSVTNLESSHGDEDFEMSVKDTSTFDKIRSIRQEVDNICDDIENHFIPPSVSKNYIRRLLIMVRDLQQIQTTVENDEERDSVQGAIVFTESVIEKLRGQAEDEDEGTKHLTKRNNAENYSDLDQDFYGLSRRHSSEDSDEGKNDASTEKNSVTINKWTKRKLTTGNRKNEGRDNLEGSDDEKNERSRKITENLETGRIENNHYHLNEVTKTGFTSRNNEEFVEEPTIDHNFNEVSRRVSSEENINGINSGSTYKLEERTEDTITKNMENKRHDHYSVRNQIKKFEFRIAGIIN